MSAQYDEAHARWGDPDTSHDAAESVGALTATRAAILEVLDTYGPLTDEEIARLYQGPRASPSGLRTRRSELVRAGKVYDTGQRRPLHSGRYAVAWASTADLRLF
jgi:hypothetical protein